MLLDRSQGTTAVDICVLSFSAWILLLWIILFILLNRGVQIYHYKIMYIFLDIPRRFVMNLNSQT